MNPTHPIAEIDLGSVIVVHGVGDQEQGRSAKDLSHTLALAASRRSGVSDVHIEPCGQQIVTIPMLPSDDKGVTADRFEIRWQSTGHSYRTRVLEFYWADESQFGKWYVANLYSLWQIVIGMPRLGLAALTARGGFPSHCVLRFAQFLFVVAWLLVVFRLIGQVIVALLVAILNVSPLRAAELALVFDLTTAAVSLLLVLTLFGLFVCNRFRSSGGTAALFALSFAMLISQVVPNALQMPQLDILGPPRQMESTTIQPWFAFTVTEPSGSVKKVNANWIYGFNTYSGFWPHVNYGLVLIIGLVFSGTYAWLFFLSRKRPDDKSRLVASLLQNARRSWRAIAISVLVVGPLIDIGTCTALWLGYEPEKIAGEPMRDPQAGKDVMLRQVSGASKTNPAATNRPIDRGPEFVRGTITRKESDGHFQVAVIDASGRKTIHNKVSAAELILPEEYFLLYGLSVFCRAVIYPFVLLMFALLFVPDVRKVLTPGLELALDVLNYLPTVPWLDRWCVLRWLLGGRPHRQPRDLASALHARLRGLIEAERQTPSHPPVVLAHSLGSIIALSAIHEAAQPPAANAPRIGHLVLMGCPMAMLSIMFPGKYDRRTTGWSLPGLAGLKNWYCAADLVGRDLRPWLVSQAAQVDDDLLGDGGHTGYFLDERVTQRLLGVLGF